MRQKTGPCVLSSFLAHGAPNRYRCVATVKGTHSQRTKSTAWSGYLNRGTYGRDGSQFGVRFLIRPPQRPAERRWDDTLTLAGVGQLAMVYD